MNEFLYVNHSQRIKTFKKEKYPEKEGNKGSNKGRPEENTHVSLHASKNGKKTLSIVYRVLPHSCTNGTVVSGVTPDRRDETEALVQSALSKERHVEDRRH